MSPIPLLDLKRQYKTIEDEVNVAVLEVLASGNYIGGPILDKFEQAFAHYTTTTECVACHSGTDALYLALRALNIGPGDQVITTPFTFIATAEAISLVGATPVFVDISAQTFNLDLDQLSTAITQRTRAILPVHLFGQPLDMTRLMAIAKTHNLNVIEDCAQAVGAEWAGQKVGCIGDVGCFSFYPTKNLGGCGDGGAVTTNDPAIAAQIRLLRDHGRRSGYLHEQVGVNSRLDTLQAAILQIKLRYANTWNAQRCAAASRYHQLLSPVRGIGLPQVLAGGESVWNQYTVRILPPLDASLDDQGNYRNQVRQQLQQQGISSMIYYPLPLHLQPVYQSLGYQPGQFPVAERAAEEVLSIPIFPELLSVEQQQVVHGLKNCLVQPVRF